MELSIARFMFGENTKLVDNLESSRGEEMDAQYYTEKYTFLS